MSAEIDFFMWNVYDHFVSLLCNSTIIKVVSIQKY